MAPLSVELWLSVIPRAECLKLSNISINITVVIFGENVLLVLGSLYMYLAIDG
jgi:hypothetical protein